MPASFSYQPDKRRFAVAVERISVIQCSRQLCYGAHAHYAPSHTVVAALPDEELPRYFRLLPRQLSQATLTSHAANTWCSFFDI